MKLSSNEQSCRNGFMAYVGSGDRPVLSAFHEIRCHQANIGTFIRKALGVGVDHIICLLSGELSRRRQPDFLECLSKGFLLILRHIDKNIPHEMHLAALPRGAGKGRPDCRNQPGVSIGNDKLGREQTTVLPILKQHSIGALGFFGHRFNSDDISISIFVHTAHDKYRHADNSAIYTNFFIQCIHSQNRVHRIGKNAITELLDLLIQSFCHLADLASG